MKSLPLLAILAVLAVPAASLADQNPTFTGQLSPSEQTFVSQMSAYLTAHFPTAAAAEKAGYVRYTDADETGAISYANLQWESADYRHPSQLWYDKNGRLLGADYSVLVSSSPSRPQLWGVNPGRWVEFDGHMHWVAKDPTGGGLKYDQWMTEKDFVGGGGNLAKPAAATLVALKKVPAASDVVTVFHFPEIWDLIVWAVPNPDGAFAWKNPNVQP